MKKILILAVGAVGYWYYATTRALLNVEFKFSKFQISSIQAEYVQFAITLTGSNTSNTDLNFNRADIEVYFNNTIIGLINQDVNQTLIKRASSEIVFYVNVFKEDTTTAIWQSILNNEFVNFRLDLKGRAVVNGRPFPLSVTFTKADLF
jgi:hypothetical protein